MLVVAITGSIGSGKSTVGDAWREQGIEVIDADDIARDVLVMSPELIEEIKQAFGVDVIDTDGRVDRRLLAAIVFADRDKLDKLNHIMHPAVIKSMNGCISECAQKGMKMVVLEVPLLFETGLDEIADVIIAIVASENLILSRLKEKGWTTGDVIDRMSMQMAQEEKAVMSDYVIENSGSKADLLAKAQLVLESVLRDIV